MNTKSPPAKRRLAASHRKWETVTKVPLVAVERRAATTGDTRLAPVDDTRRHSATNGANEVRIKRS